MPIVVTNGFSEGRSAGNVRATTLLNSKLCQAHDEFITGSSQSITPFHYMT